MQFLNASAELQYFSLQLGDVHVDRIECHDSGVALRQPAAGGRTRDASLAGAVNFPRGVDQIPQSVILTTLRADCGGHHPIMTTPDGRSNRRIAFAGQISRNGENSRAKVRNVVTRSRAKISTSAPVSAADQRRPH